MFGHLLLLAMLATTPDAGVARGENRGLVVGAGFEGNPANGILRRFITPHLDEVRLCYEPELATKPLLAGRIVVGFTINAAGQVIAASRKSSTVDDPQVEDCAVGAVRTWAFPKPLGGGTVGLSYIFALRPAVSTRVVPGAGGVVVDLELLDRGIIVHRTTDAGGLPANGLIVIVDDGLLLFDTGWTEVQTAAILKWGDDQLKRRWLGAVITHDHPDRDGGLAALQKRKIPVAALDLTVAKLEHRGVRGVDTLFTASAGAFLDPRGFKAIYPGPGHTSDNIVLRRLDVVFAGCLVKALEAEELGFTGDADLAAWPDSVRRIAAVSGQVTIVPGHGAVDPSGAAFQHTLDLLSAAAAAKRR